MVALDGAGSVPMTHYALCLQPFGCPYWLQDSISEPTTKLM
jgi:hypothetical protein